jgi:myo-inositol-1-phosphate synthase
MELKLEVWDSPNSAGVVIDAIRCIKLALENNISGSLEAPSSYFMKSPPVQYTDDIAHDSVEEFIVRYAETRNKAEEKMAEMTETLSQSPAAPSSDGITAVPTEVAPVVSTNGRK